jgi:hypothetical protein
MEEKTSADYDSLLSIFCGKDEMRPVMLVPNKTGDKTYATDSYAAIVINNQYLKNIYDYNEKFPDIESIFNRVVQCEPEKIKDTSLFKALEAHPKMYDVDVCGKCDGEGECSCCSAKCDRCKGEGYVEDKSKPMLHGETGTIQIGDQFFFPLQLGRLEKVVLELMVDEFYIIGRSEMAALFKVGEIQILICRVMTEHVLEDKLPNYFLI